MGDVQGDAAYDVHCSIDSSFIQRKYIPLPRVFFQDINEDRNLLHNCRHECLYMPSTESRIVYLPPPFPLFTLHARQISPACDR